MMPLTMCKAGEENEIKKIGGKEETRRHLENLGFVALHTKCNRILRCCYR